MRNLGRGILAALAVTLVSGAAWAAGTHKGGHYSFGEPGRAERRHPHRRGDRRRPRRHALRDGRRLDPAGRGDQVRRHQPGYSSEHEFSIGDTASQRAHAKLMAKNPDMKHENDPTAVHAGAWRDGGADLELQQAGPGAHRLRLPDARPLRGRHGAPGEAGEGEKGEDELAVTGSAGPACWAGSHSSPDGDRYAHDVDHPVSTRQGVQTCHLSLDAEPPRGHCYR